jgi:hypothetical protein
VFGQLVVDREIHNVHVVSGLTQPCHWRGESERLAPQLIGGDEYYVHGESPFRWQQGVPDPLLPAGLTVAVVLSAWCAAHSWHRTPLIASCHGRPHVVDRAPAIVPGHPSRFRRAVSLSPEKRSHPDNALFDAIGG